MRTEMKYLILLLLLTACGGSGGGGSGGKSKDKNSCDIEDYQYIARGKCSDYHACTNKCDNEFPHTDRQGVIDECNDKGIFGTFECDRMLDLNSDNTMFYNTCIDEDLSGDMVLTDTTGYEACLGEP